MISCRGRHGFCSHQYLSRCFLWFPQKMAPALSGSLQKPPKKKTKSHAGFRLGRSQVGLKGFGVDVCPVVMKLAGAQQEMREWTLGDSRRKESIGKGLQGVMFSFPLWLEAKRKAIRKPTSISYTGTPKQTPHPHRNGFSVSLVALCKGVPQKRAMVVFLWLPCI